MSFSIESKIIEPYLVLSQSLAPLRLSRWQMFKLVVRAILYSTLPRVFLFGTFLSLIVYGLSRKIWGRQKREPDHGLPIVQRNDYHFDTIIAEGKQQYPNKPFMAINKRYRFVIYPVGSWDEFKRIPEQTASVMSFQHVCNSGNWSLVGGETHELVKTITAELTRSLPARVPNRQEDAKITFDTIIGHCSEEKGFNLLMTSLEIIAKINACTFVGRELGRNQRWVKAVIYSPLFVYMAVTLLNATPGILRPLLRPLYFLPVLKNYWDMKRLLKPKLDKDIETFKGASDKRKLLVPKPDEDLPFTQFLLSRYTEAAATIKQLVTDYIQVSYTSTPTTASALYHALWELAQNPEAADVLRQELKEVMIDGKLPRTHLQELKRMDSFLRESFRLHPITRFTLQRYVKEPFQLCDGSTIPPGVMAVVDAQEINRSPELWENPDKFDMDRFYRLRELSGNDNRYHFVTTSSNSPGWGDGTQACPGRFFATSTLKIVMAHVVMNYDIRLSKTAPLKSTPLVNGSYAPDNSVEILFKSRSSK
ncbi:cytochrome P450 oxidoreductase [Colletotrichum tofieldiae]|uniref:Cytochrome P450 oxidoreductase n=1 Tax=Colletotrichum tofieldiae TaxID=708197 RepID=A0A166WBU8_9PEZI|nr:cytochrome P450 oxidoreductase [Colletotrichum tofieldiae]GKT83710.1 cytochrome P450 oxidoreductase [Colletotrichum tofieldiae]